MPRIVDTLKSAREESNGTMEAIDSYDHTPCLAINDDEIEVAEHSVNPEPEPILVDEEESEQFLFIEVGGPNKQVEGSPEVLAVSAPSRVGTHRKKTPVEEPPANGECAERTAVSFHPWPEAGETDVPGIAPNLIAYHQPDHSVSKQYEGLLEQVLSSAETKKSLLFTSVHTAEIATATVLNLAIVANRDLDRKVVVVDANRMHPAVAKWLGAPDSPGLQDVLAGSAALEASVRTTQANDLKILSAGSEYCRHSEAAGNIKHWTSDALQWTLRWLSDRFDLVLLDGGVWEDGTAAQITPLIPSAVYPVVAADNANEEQFHKTIRQICDAGGDVRGVIYFNPLAV